MADHWRTRKCELTRSAHPDYCTYPDCDCSTGELRDDNDPAVHGNVYFFRPDSRMEADAARHDDDRMQGGRGQEDGDSGIHWPSKGSELRMRPSEAAPADRDRDLRLARAVFTPGQIVGALCFVGALICFLVMALRAAGAK